MSKTTPGVRCEWVDERDALMVRYHDEEWGVPLHDDRALFELLILEGAQAGLSWRTVLHRREAYRAAFAGWDLERIARFGPSDVERLLGDAGIIRNRAKVESTIGNARAALLAAERFGSLDGYLWGLAGGVVRTNRWRSLSEVPAETAESRAMSRELRRDGFRFVGPTICYALMQAAGMVNDHLPSCFCSGTWAQMKRSPDSRG